MIIVAAAIVVNRDFWEVEVNAPRLQGGASKPKLKTPFPVSKYFSSPFTKWGIQIGRIHKCSAQNVNSHPAPGLRGKGEGK